MSFSERKGGLVEEDLITRGGDPPGRTGEYMGGRTIWGGNFLLDYTQGESL